MLKRCFQQLKTYQCLLTVNRRVSMGQQPRLRPSTSSTRYFILPLPVFFTYMMFLQQEKKKEKDKYLEMVEKRKAMPIVPFPDNLSDIKNMEFRKVKVRGHYEYDNEIFIGPRSDIDDSMTMFGMKPRGSSGFYIITPFQLENGVKIMVNRGWYSDAQMATDGLRGKGRIYGTIELTGEIRFEQKVGKWLRWVIGNYEEPQRPQGEVMFMVRVLNEMAKYCQTEPIYITALDGRVNKDCPKLVQEVKELQNLHGAYATVCGITAAICFAIYFRYKQRTPVRRYMR